MTGLKRVSRWWLAAAMPVIGIVLAATLLYAVQSRPGDAAASMPSTPAFQTAAPSPQPGAPAPSPATTLADLPDGSAPAAPDADAVVLVDGAPITQQALDAAITLDRVMAELAGQSPSSPAQVLEQLINTELVWQRADLRTDAQATTAVVEKLLASSGHTAADLTAALTANNISETSFQHSIARLVAVDAYLRAEQSVTGVSAAESIRGWQMTARISFGPAANMLAPTPQPAPPTLISTDTAATDPAVEPTATAVATLPAAVAPTATPPALNEPRGTAVGQIAPDFTLPVLADQSAPVSFDDLVGRPTLLSFWTTWCPYCLRQTPVLVEAAARWSDAGVAFVGIDVAESREAVAAYASEHAIPYPILLDEAGDVAAAYAVQGYPTTYFLDRDGRIVARHIGALTDTQLNTYLEMLRPPEPQPQKVSP